MSAEIKHPGSRPRADEVQGSVTEGVVDEHALTDSVTDSVTDSLKDDLRTRVNAILNRHPTVGLALGVVRDGRLAFFHAHGLADIASRTPVTEDTVFRVASVTKTFTAIAVMQLWEQGLVDLDAPANDYLRAYQLIPARPTLRLSFRPATIRHLLTHTAGIREVLHPSGLLRLRDLGETVKPERAPSLAEYYHGGLRLDAEPGTRWMYTDHGFATLGQIIEDVTGQPLGRYLRERVFEPLGMTNTDLIRSARIASHLATGYELRSDGARAVDDYDVVTAGGGGVYSTPRDMARYLAALLGGGANEHGRVLKPETLASMFASHFQTDSRIPGMGLAFFRATFGGHLAVEHGGILPGFDAQIWLAPDDGVGVMAFSNGGSGARLWLTEPTADILRQLLGVPEDVVRPDVPHRPELWGDLCGWYRFSTHTTDPARFGLGAGAEVFVRRGQLMMRFLSPLPALYQGLPLHPDDDNDPYVFQIRLSLFGSGARRVAFTQEPGGGTTALHLDFGPLSFPKQPDSTNPRLLVTGALGALGVAATTAIAIRRSRTPT